MVGIRNVINVQSSLRALQRRIKASVGNDHNALSQHLSPIDSGEQPPLNAVLSKWKREYIREPQSSLAPQDVLQTVDDWRRFLDDNFNISSSGSSNLEQQEDENAILSQRPDTKSYMYIIEAAANASKAANPSSSLSIESAEFADRLLLRLLEDAKTDFNIQPTSSAFVAVCQAWASVADRHSSSLSSTKIEEWMQRLQRLNDEGWPGLDAPNVVLWNILLSAWSREGNIAQIENTLQRMIQNEIPGVSPDTVSFSTLLAAYSRIGTVKAAANADSLLHQMLALYQNGIDSVRPNAVSFTNVMQCHAKQGNVEAVREWLQALENLYERTLDDDIKPDVTVYNTCLSAMVQFPEQAQQFLQTSFPSDVPPNERSYNIVLSAWAEAGDPYQAEAVLQNMHDFYVSSELETKPSVVSYNTVLSAYAKLAAKTSARQNNKNDNRNDHDENAPWKRAENILQHMESLSDMGDDSVRPDERTWNIVLDVCAKSGRVDVAERLLQRMKDANESKPIASIRMWNALLSACMQTADLSRAKQLWKQIQEDDSIHPDVVSYNTYLNCFVRASMERQRGQGGKHGISKQQEAELVEAIFKQMLRDQNVEPNRITYLSMINFWISRDDPERAEAVLSEMVHACRQEGTNPRSASNRNHFSPDRDLFHKVMDAWVPRKRPKKAEALLLVMSDLDEHHGFNLRPTVDTYNVLLECWAKSGRLDSGERAEMILREMQALSQSGDRHVCPNIISYNRVLNAWANSKNPTAATRSDSLVLEMILKQDSNTMPDVVSYNTWVKTIALSKDTDKAKRADDVLKMMKIHEFRPMADLMKKIRDLQQSTTRSKQ
jgi:pentatricopeptide repeat protein